MTLPVDQDGLTRCVLDVELVYEPDILGIDFFFTQTLVQHGMRSLVLSPLAVEGKTQEVLVVARRAPDAFQSIDFEFLKRLGEHVAVAAHQTKLRDRLRQAYEDLKLTQQAVVERERLIAIGQMASGIAHDINNAISPVSIYTQSLIERDLVLPPEVKGYLGLVNGVVQDLTATVARMRDFYRPSLADGEIAPVDLNVLVLQVLEHSRARWHDMPLQRGVVISVETALHENLPMIQGTASELREMMTNLVFNAIDAMPDGGTLTLRTDVLQVDPALPPRVLLEVVDSGVGMDVETSKRCLEPFFTTKGERGTGLGLAMVYGAAQRHDGQIEIRSAPGDGTTFGLQFLAIEGVAAAKELVESLPTRALRLLLVDDDPAVLRSHEMVIGRDGHSIVTAGNGQDAIELMQKAAGEGDPFDVVITDLGMPYMDGNQVARAVKAQSAETSVILLTGWGRRMGHDGEAPTNIDFVIAKPFRMPEMRAALAKISQKKFQAQDAGWVDRASCGG